MTDITIPAEIRAKGPETVAAYVRRGQRHVQLCRSCVCRAILAKERIGQG